VRDVRGEDGRPVSISPEIERLTQKTRAGPAKLSAKRVLPSSARLPPAILAVRCECA